MAGVLSHDGLRRRLLWSCPFGELPPSPSSAITAWVGRYRLEDGESVIETLWQMTSLGKELEDGFWHSINAGSDRFTRVLVSSVDAGGSAKQAAETVGADATP